MTVLLLILTWIFKENGWNIPVWIWMVEVALIMLHMFGIVFGRPASNDPEYRKRQYYGEMDEDRDC